MIWAQEAEPETSANEAETAGSSMTIPSSEAPIDISADRNNYDLRAGVVEYIEDVYIERGPMQIHADRAIFRETEGEIAEIELFGAPVEWQDQLEDGTIVSGEANNIFFDVIANVVTLTGNSVIRHEQGEFTGDRLVYDLTNENLSGSSEGDNRVRARIEPGALPDDN
ncbi:MAG: lipopolysaccharide transport periplasmic protein LptA [Pseudomonadota bacterium]